MTTQNISPSAYILRQQWEHEDKKLFRKFQKENGSMEVINALAEMMVGVQSGRSVREFQI